MERRQLDDEVRVLVPGNLEAEGFLVSFTERTGGVSEGPYASLNLAFRTGDRPARIVRNRGRLRAALGIAEFAVARQVHGSHLVSVGRARAGLGFAKPEARLEADALSVSLPQTPVAVLTADCVPLALASPSEQRAVVVHAGWRGLTAGIVRRALRTFDEPKDVRAAIGPAIGACHYEVGADVALAVSAGSQGGAVVKRRDGRVFVDLAATVRRSLRVDGVRSIEEAGVCTACEETRFFSHRRDGARTGRQALIAMRM
jgi:hypothetical protein